MAFLPCQARVQSHFKINLKHVVAVASSHKVNADFDVLCGKLLALLSMQLKTKWLKLHAKESAVPSASNLMYSQGYSHKAEKGNKKWAILSSGQVKVFKPCFVQSVRQCTTLTRNVNAQELFGSHNDKTEPSSQLSSECDSPERVLEFLDHRLNEGSLQSHHIVEVARQFQEQIYSKLSFSWLSTTPLFRKKQFQYSQTELDAIVSYTSDKRWEGFMSLARSQIDCMALRDQAVLLSILNLLYISTKNELFDLLLHNCVRNIHRLKPQDLVLLSNVIGCQFQNDFITFGRINAAVHDIMLQTPVVELDVSDICTILKNTNCVNGDETLQQVAQVINKKLEQDPSSMTAGAFVRAYQLMTGCRSPYMQGLALDLVGIATIRENVFEELPVQGSTLAKISKHPWPFSHLLEKVWRCCLADIGSSAEDLEHTDFIKLSYCLPSVHPERLLPLIEKADIFLLFQMIGNHMTVQLEMTSDTCDIFKAYYNRLLDLTSGLNQTELEKLCSCDDGQIAETLLKFLKLVSSIGIQPSAILKEKISAAGLHLDRAGCDTPAPIAAVMLQWATDILSSNTLLSHNNLATLILLASRLDFPGMLILYEQWDKIIGMPYISGQVKRQTQKLRAKVQAQFESRLNRATNLPNALALGVQCEEREENVQPHHVRNRPGLYKDLLSSLGRFVATGDKHTHNCLGILAVLDSTSEHWPMYQEELLEDLTSFIVHECSSSLTPALQLLKALSSVGYIPQDTELFTTWLWALVSKMLKIDILDRCPQVQMAYYMSLLSLFHDDLLSSIFTLSFITEWHEELKGKPEKYRRKICQEFLELSRSVAIECPHLAVACMEEPNTNPYKTSRQDFFNMERMVASMRRVCKDDRCLIAPSRSPYSHHIDAELVLDSCFTPVTLPDKNNSTMHLERVAFLYGSEQNYCMGQCDHLTGQKLSDIRQLQMLGYTIVLVPHYDLSSMEMYSEQALDNFITEKMNAAVGTQVFSPHNGDK